MKDLISECSGLATVLESVSEVAAYLWQNGWAERNAGNLSVDVTDLLSGQGDLSATGPALPLEFVYPDLAGRCYLVTGTGRRYRDLCRDACRNSCIVRMSDGGTDYSLVWGGEGTRDFRPTSEWPSHLRIHEFLRQSGAEERVVLHTHPTEIIAVTHLPDYLDEPDLQRALLCTHPEVKVTLPRGAGLVPYTVPGTEALAQATVDVFRRGYPVAIWQWHGVVAIGTEVTQAFDLIDTVNKSAKVLLLIHSAGHKPQGLGKEQLDELVSTFGLKE